MENKYIYIYIYIYILNETQHSKISCDACHVRCVVLGTGKGPATTPSWLKYK